MSAWRAMFAEFIATALFVFFGAGSVVITGELLGEAMTTARMLAIAAVHGGAIFVLVSIFANVSGAHINPIITLAAALNSAVTKSGLKPKKSLLYIFAQLSGAAIGALILAAITPNELQGNLGSHIINQRFSINTGFYIETIITFFLTITVLLTTVNPRTKTQMAPFTIGMVVFLGHMFAIPITGASMNPARSFGPALISGAWGDWFNWLRVFVVAPVTGSLIATWTYLHILHEK